MDLLYGSDHKLGDLEDDMNDFLDNDVFSSPNSENSDSYMDNDWFNSFFEDPVLNDKMITDAAQPPRIQSEHSYSLHNEQNLNGELGLVKMEELDSDFLLLNNNALDLTTKTPVSEPQQPQQPVITPKQEPIEIVDPIMATATATPTVTTTRTFTVTKQPTIILATSTGQMQSERSVLPKITVKTEPPDFYDAQMDHIDHPVNIDSLVLPPTPPSSNNSDSDSCSSPQPSAPSSPVRQLPLSRQYSISSSSLSPCSLSPTSSSRAFSQPNFTNPIPQSGILVLSEEEKRTLISEGYPIPQKLPLTKQEEKNLKKIRRKIKNKISAQESRRKKKEYLEALEKRVESFSHENNELKKKVDTLENNNRSLLSQLQKLQSLVGKIPRPNGSTQHTGTALMVLVLCFAVFVGSWAPTSLNIGYSSSNSGVSAGAFFANPQLVKPSPMMGPAIESAKVDNPYSTSSLKSRVLLSCRDDQDDWNWYEPYGPNVPYGEKEHVDKREQPPKVEGNTKFGPNAENATISEKKIEEMLEKVVKVITVDSRFSQANGSSNTEEYQASMHPDLVASADFLKAEASAAVEKIETA